MKKKDIKIFVAIFSLLLLISGATYAYWIWNSNTNKNVSFNTASGLENYIVYNEGNSYFVGNFQPTLTYCEGVNTTLSFYKTSSATMDIVATIYMSVNSIGTNISQSSDVYWVLTKGDNTITCDNGLLDSEQVINYGTFNGVKDEDTIALVTGLEVTTTEQMFTVWIWIDSNGTDLSLLSGETVDTNIWTQFDMRTNKPEAPVLDENGMIPVVISDTGVVTTISSMDSNWYNYKNKEWANVILTTSDSRSNYLGTSGVEVTQSDILAYYVWIPRYKYQIWTTETSSSGNEQPIEIIFEAKEDSMSLGTTVGSYRTHPAFWWDNDSDGVVDSGETLAGIWVGKFETTGNATTPTILPDKQSKRSQKVSEKFTTSLKFSGGTLTDGIVTYTGNDTYGLSNTTNSHMMKNSEWGAAAYLSHSIYGADREIYINNSSSFYTGRSGGNVGGSTAINTVYTDQTSTDQYNSYGFYTWDGYLLDYGTNTKGTTHDITKVASTTGNITGIYDMSGGAWEYVMGVLADDNGNPRSGYTTSNNSGFNGLLVDGTSYTSGITFPTSEYYDLYTSTDPSSDTMSLSTTACSGGICYGYALSETASWYGDYANFVSSGHPWFLRGGGYDNGTSAGAFYSSSGSGGAVSTNSWRSVLAIG